MYPNGNKEVMTSYLHNQFHAGRHVAEDEEVCNATIFSQVEGPNNTRVVSIFGYIYPKQPHERRRFDPHGEMEDLLNIPVSCKSENVKVQKYNFW